MEILKSISTEKNLILESDCWEGLREFTNARIALGRTGASLPTEEVLKFGLSHARAKDAIHTPFDQKDIIKKLEHIGMTTISVSSAAPNRAVYLTRPDLGRKLSEKSYKELQELNAKETDIVLVIGDGLSSKAVHKQSVPLIENLLPYLKQLNLKIGPIVLAEQSRVALGDEIGMLLKSKLIAILIGERPGLSSPDSLGVYITWNPYVGRLESDRNCISNIRPEGLNYQKAAFKMAWLIEQAFDIEKTGVQLKDMSDSAQYHKLLRPKEFVIE